MCVSGVDKGLYITCSHYTNVVHPVKTLFTGMTRDGTFLIEHGALTQPVKTLRFTQSILEVLLHVQDIGREQRRLNDYLPVVAPALRSAAFNFTGITGS